MNLSTEQLKKIFQKYKGRCAYDGKKLSWNNYGKIGSWGAWEVDHSKPKSKGGTDYLRNLAPACIECNRNKSNKTRGCKFLLSNSNSKEVRKIFSNRSWKIFEIEANRAINSDSKKRTGHSELLIKNY